MLQPNITFAALPSSTLVIHQSMQDASAGMEDAKSYLLCDEK
jgi:hypothetical protein